MLTAHSRGIGPHVPKSTGIRQRGRASAYNAGIKFCDALFGAFELGERIVQSLQLLRGGGKLGELYIVAGLPVR